MEKDNFDNRKNFKKRRRIWWIILPIILLIIIPTANKHKSSTPRYKQTHKLTSRPIVKREPYKPYLIRKPTHKPYPR